MDGNIRFYDNFARFYDLANPRNAAEFECHTRLARGAGSVLEVCCGTGTLTTALRSSTQDYVGLDAAPAMLDIARERHPSASFHLGDMRDFDLGRQFDHVVCAFNSLFHLVNHADVVMALSCMARHCVPGGRVVIDNYNVLPKYVPTQLRGAVLNRFTCPESGAEPMLALEDSDFDKETMIVEVNWSIAEAQTGKVVAREHFNQRLYQVNQITDLIQAAGMTLSACYGDHDLSPLNPLSPRLIAVATP